ncbi:MAG: hypothetical protein R3B71_01165 [Candidatus Gracilibacteria bacterium]|nr:hypothetical protein [Candidatus Peregrinibacteria bacterium]
MNKLNAHALGAASALLAALCMLVIGILAMMGVYMEAYQIMKAFHIWFDATLIGTLIGMVEAGVISYIAGYLFAELYNRLSKS